MNLTSLLDFLNDWRADFPDAVAQLHDAQRDAEKSRARLMQTDDAKLSIGIMGQVKAGKSSFLNSLLFDGRSVLPEAATPKTANLTRIRYAEKPSFTARFYRPEDWQEIERQASSQTEDNSSRAAKELVNSARDSGADLQKLLAQGEFTLQADDLNGLIGELNNYVGSDGRLTALVAETELALPIPKLEGVEIVDTPGMNDPVVSRTDKTRKYMALCDVVFFLSRSSQFLDKSDLTLLTMQLPETGIRRLIVVGAQFDMAVLDDGRNRPSLQACQSRLIERLGQRAQDSFIRLALQREKQGYEKIAELLRSIDVPIFASTYAWLIAKQPQQNWNDGVRHTQQEISELARDKWRSSMTQDDWSQLANFAPLVKAMEQERSNKEAILAERRANLESDLAGKQAEHLRQLRELAQDRLSTLQHKELADLSQREKAQQQQLDKIISALAGFLRETSDNVGQRYSGMVQDVKKGAKEAGKMDERTGQETRIHWTTVSDSTWWKPWTWGDERNESYTTTHNCTYLAASDAIGSLRRYIQEARSRMLHAFDDILAQETMSADLRQKLWEVVDANNPDFDPQGLRALVEVGLGQLKLPTLDFQAPDVDSVFSGFSPEVKNSSDMQRLRKKLEAEVIQLEATLIKRLETAVNQITQALKSMEAHLGKSLTKSLAEEMSRLRAAMQDKEHQVKRLQGLIKAIDAV